MRVVGKLTHFILALEINSHCKVAVGILLRRPDHFPQRLDLLVCEHIYHAERYNTRNQHGNYYDS